MLYKVLVQTVRQVRVSLRFLLKSVIDAQLIICTMLDCGSVSPIICISEFYSTCLLEGHRSISPRKRSVVSRLWISLINFDDWFSTCQYYFREILESCDRNWNKVCMVQSWGDWPRWFISCVGPHVQFCYDPLSRLGLGSAVNWGHERCLAEFLVWYGPVFVFCGVILKLAEIESLLFRDSGLRWST